MDTNSNQKNKHGKQDIFEELGNAFNDLLSHNLSDIFTHSRPGANIIEAGDHFRIELATPGLSKKDLSIKIDKDRLQVSADREASKKEGEHYKLREFHFGKFNRSFIISDKVDRTKVKASMSNGILTIKMHKRKETIDNENVEIEIQ